MADTKTTGLTALTGANLATGDTLMVVDVSDTTMAATGSNKKITAAEMLIGIASISSSVTLANPLTLSAGLVLGSGAYLYGDAANTLALRNSTNAQTFNIYNTYTDGSNYERGFMRWSSNILTIGAEAAGTGSNRAVRIVPGGTPVGFLISATEASMEVKTNISNNVLYGHRIETQARTSDATENYAGRLITNRGATGTVTRTLQIYTDNIIFKRIATQAFRIEPSSGKAFRRANGTLETADKYLELASDGATVHIVYDGTEFVCLYESGTINVEP